MKKKKETKSEERASEFGGVLIGTTVTSKGLLHNEPLDPSKGTPDAVVGMSVVQGERSEAMKDLPNENTKPDAFERIASDIETEDKEESIYSKLAECNKTLTTLGQITTELARSRTFYRRLALGLGLALVFLLLLIFIILL